MKPFLSKFLIICLIYLLISVAISHFSSYHWGNPWYSSKVHFLEKNKNSNYNTFFFGSSRVYRQINPEIFDSVYNAYSNEKINSFNLGAPATFNPQTYFLYEKFLESELSNEVKFCFIELMEVDLLQESFLHQERTSYWQNLSDLSFVFKSVYSNKELSLKTKINTYINYSIAYVDKLFQIGRLKNRVGVSEFYNVQYLGNSKNGYFPLEEELEIAQSEGVNSAFIERQNSFNAENNNERKQEISKAHKDASLEEYDKVHLERIKDLIQLSEEKGVKLFFILSPRYISQGAINLSYLIPNENILDMSNPEIFEIFYNYENCFDVGHLNLKGSSLYSEMLAKEFEKK